MIAALFALVAATPEVKYAFNSQLPPVARYGEAYSYTLNSDTFSSSETITLSCPDLPSWLSFDASTSTLSGTAPSDSQGDQTLNFTILAADSTGTIVSDCQLALIDTEEPNTTESLVTVLRDAGPTSDPDSVVLSPGEDFEIDFPSDFFSSDGRSVVGHYSVTNQHAPLPIWLNFDGASGKYWGTAPTVNSDIAQAEEFPILFIESTVEGFTTAQASFNILVGAHSFTTSLGTVDLNVTEGEFISYQIPLSEIQLNNVSVTAANISTVTIGELPSWLSWSSSNYSLSGTATEANSSYIMPITVNDLYNDSVEFNLKVTVQAMENTTVFKSSSLGPVNVTQGQFFSYSIADSLVSQDVDVSISSTADWVTYHSSNYSIQGQVPSDFNDTTITLSASKNNLRKRDNTGTSATLTLLGVKSSTTTSSSSSSSHSATATSSGTHHSGTSTATATASATSAAAASSKKSNKTVALACGLAIPLGLLLIAAILLLFCCCRRRRRRNAFVRSPSTLNEKQVSKPVLIKSDDSPAFTTLPQQASATSERTMMDTPPVDNENATDWTTPQRVSTFNYLQMDDADSKTQLVGGAPGATSSSSDAAKAAAVTGAVAMGSMRADPHPTATAANEAPAPANVPRASWRHTNLTDRRWQDNRMSYNSIASVADSQAQIQPAGHGYNLPRDESSGIVHRMDSGLSSPEQSMYFNQANNSSRQAIPEEDNASSDYHTASSGDEAEEPYNGDSSPDIMSYKNDAGQFEFRQERHGDERAQLRNSTAQAARQTAKHQSHVSQSGELAFI